MRIYRFFIAVFISVFICTSAFAAWLWPWSFPRDRHLVFEFNARHHLVKDRVSGTAFSQTYAGTNRNLINASGLLEAVAANTPVIDHVSASLVPTLRLEPAAANLLFSTRTFTVAAEWSLHDNVTTSKTGIIGVDGVAGNGTRATESDDSNTYNFRKQLLKSATDSTTYYTPSLHFKKTSGAATFPGFGVYFTGVADRYALYAINTDTGVATAEAGNNAANRSVVVEDKGTHWKVSASAQDNGANTSLYFVCYPAVNTDASSTWAVGTTGYADVDAAMLTTGAIPSSYFDGAAAIGSELIAAQVDRDFSGASAWANVDLSAYNETGDLTITATGIGQYCTLPVANAPTTATTTVVQLQFTIANIISSWDIKSFDGTQTFGSVAANGTYYLRFIPSTTGGIRIVSTGATSSGDFDNFSLKTCGTVRLSEAKTVTLATSTAQLAALAGTGSFAMKVRFPYAKTQVTAASTLLAFADSATSFLYMDSSGVLYLNDGTNTATNNDTFVANTDYIISGNWNKTGTKMDLGLGVPGSVSWDAEADFAGAFTTTGSTTYPGHTLAGGVHIYWIYIWDALQSNAKINQLR